MKDQIVYYVATGDPNIGNIWTLLPANKEHGEKKKAQMTLKEFVDRNWTNDDRTPHAGDVMGVLIELLERITEVYG